MTDIGDTLHAHARALYPICRSITGPGLRQTLDYIGQQIPLQRTEVPTGTRVLDWEIPREWTPRSARLSTLDGRVLVDFADHNLHLLQYSHGIDRVVPLQELQAHLHSIPEQPELIPYRTAYYADTWGLCLPHRLREQLTDEAYRVQIDASLAPGALSYGECFLPGDSAQEVLVSIHCCHPSLANDNLSGIALGIELARLLQAMPRRHSWRLLFIPGTIGSIAWLAANRAVVPRIMAGMVLSCLGDAGPLHWKQTRDGNAYIDRIAAHVLRHHDPCASTLPFSPYGYDERQYSSPGFRLPVGCLMRSPNGTFPQYHTSADNLDFIAPRHLGDSFAAIAAMVEVLEEDGRWISNQPYGEPQLGRRGLYGPIGGTGPAAGARGFSQMSLLWLLNLADGEHSLLQTAEKAGVSFTEILHSKRAATAAGLQQGFGKPHENEISNSERIPVIQPAREDLR